jgi:hypothetical protein
MPSRTIGVIFRTVPVDRLCELLLEPVIRRVAGRE